MILLLIPLLFYLFVYLGRKKPAIALITCPFACIVFFLLGAAEGNLISMLSAPAILFTTLFVIMFSRYDPDKELWPKVFVKYLILTFFCITCSICIGLLFGPLGFIGFLFIIIFIASIITYLLTSRYATAAFIISTIGASIRQNLPLPMALESASTGLADGRVIILRRIKDWLVQGYSLSESIRRGYPSCPGHALAMIATAERIDQLPNALKTIETNLTAKVQERNRLKPVHPIYPVIVVSFMFFILLLMMFFVMPQFSTALAEMTDDLQLPAITRHVFAVVDFMVRDLGLLFVLSLILIYLIIIPFSIYIKFRPRRPEDPYMLSVIGDKIKWRLPILHWFERNYSMVQAVEMLRLSLNAGCTVNDAIANTIDLDVNRCFRELLKDWLEKVEDGYNISESAEEAKLGSALAWAFDDKINPGNTINILEMLEAFYRTNYNYCINLARYIMWPSIILFIGIIVGIIVVALYSPSVEIINTILNSMSP